MAAYLAPGRLPTAGFLPVLCTEETTIEVRIFRSCTRPERQQTLRDLLVSPFLFIRSTKRSRALLFGAGNARRLRREPNLQNTTYRERSTEPTSIPASRTLTAGRLAPTRDPFHEQPFASSSVMHDCRKRSAHRRHLSIKHSNRRCSWNGLCEDPTHTRSDANDYEHILRRQSIDAPFLGGATQPAGAS